MPNAYNVNNIQMVIRPSAMLAVKMAAYAKCKGVSRSAAACMLISGNDDLAHVAMPDDWEDQVNAIVGRNVEKRRQKKTKSGK